MIVKILMTLNIDTEEYPMPVDGYVSDEIEESLREHFYDIDGMVINRINVIQEGINK
jgi:hypothetical protein|tara:strand:- start:3137 stop:3307 length:171 start_codon:yes stop_codon:yes gene_type:complete